MVWMDGSILAVGGFNAAQRPHAILIEFVGANWSEYASWGRRNYQGSEALGQSSREGDEAAEFVIPAGAKTNIFTAAFAVAAELFTIGRRW